MIPIRNVFYMLAYAWNHLQESRTIDLSGVAAETPENLLALVLARGALRLLKRGIDQDYRQVEADIRGIRGRVQIDSTIKRVLTTRGQVACLYDERSEDIMANRIIAATLHALKRLSTLDRTVRSEIDLAANRFPRVSPIHISTADFSNVVIHRNNRFYRFLLDICRLIHEQLIPDEENSRALRFVDFRRDEARMHQLFEHFVRNFLKLEQRVFSVSAKKVLWDVSDSDDISLSYLPEMQTDIVLENDRLVRIIDTKYYAQPLVEYHGSRKIDSSHLYQITSYLRNQAAREGETGRRVEAMLLYAQADKGFVFRYLIGGHRVVAASVRLDDRWDGVKEQILRLCARTDTEGDNEATA